MLITHSMLVYGFRKALEGLGKKWDAKTLDKYLKSPAEYAPGK